MTENSRFLHHRSYFFFHVCASTLGSIHFAVLECFDLIHFSVIYSYICISQDDILPTILAPMYRPTLHFYEYRDIVGTSFQMYAATASHLTIFNNQRY
jgi:hypothetical protein